MENDKLTVREVFEAIKEIQADKLYIDEVLLQVSTVKSEGPGDIGAQARAQALGQVVQCRETTNQQLLELYRKMYEDMQQREAQKVDLISRAFDRNMAFINDSDTQTEDKFAALTYVTDKIAELVEKTVTEEG